MVAIGLKQTNLTSLFLIVQFDAVEVKAYHFVVLTEHNKLLKSNKKLIKIIYLLNNMK